VENRELSIPLVVLRNLPALVFKYITNFWSLQVFFSFGRSPPRILDTGFPSDNRFSMKKFLTLSLLAPALVLATPKKQEVKQANICPPLGEVSKELKGFFPIPQLEVVEVKPSPVNSICEAVLKVGGQKLPIYIDKSGRYIFLGMRNGLATIFDLKTKENITRNEIEELNKLSQKQVHELDKYVAFTYGKKGKVVYLFTDPECPFCQRLEPTLKKLADEGKIQVRVILFPLPFHPHAKEKAVAIVCKNIGWQGLRGSYWNEQRMEKLNKWQCKKGEELVKKGMEIGQKYGVSGTPTMITSDGKKVVGALPEPMLKKELGIK